MAFSHPLLDRYEPSPVDPFDAVKAAHLLNRAGFGGTPDEIEHVRSIGPEAAVDELLDFPELSAEEQNEADVPDLSAIDGVPKTFRELNQQVNAATDLAAKQKLRQAFNQANMEVLMETMAWWLKRMAHGQHPLQEKLTLFWHGHFTTSAKDEHMASLMWRQNELLRGLAAGNFGKLAHAISRDPAMLDYLNNTQNRKAHPNENYARELMELFTLGIGHYTETDVKQGARAFTGWTHDGEQFTFQPGAHDAGLKVFLGRTGYFDGDDVVNIILQNPQCATFIATEIYRYFATDDLDPKLPEALGQILRENNYELRPLLRTILTSKVFYTPRVVGVQIKSPVQLVVGSIRMLGLEMPATRAIVGTLTQMGQVPFMPPNVRGWLGGRTWINTSTLFVRYNAGVWLTGGQVPGFLQGRMTGKEIHLRDAGQREAGVAFDPSGSEQSSAERLVNNWLAALIQRPVDPKQKEVLVDAISGGGPNSERKLVQLIMSMPEYQLC
jgi:uncharacterized protein (DUF1800 family)